MTDDIKRRGRPKGSEKDDSEALAAIADLMLTEPNLKPTTAMRRFNRNANESTIRRWQSKWRQRKAALLAEAKDRRAASVVEHRSSSPVSMTDVLGDVEALYNSPAVRAALAFQESPEMRALRKVYNSPEMKAMRAMREIHNSPAMQVMREVHRKLAALNLQKGW
ncbi:hypothetical protein [Stakelama tenebrarum]|uniref:Uncharacterized protein n=1 Tax=Stakelama tenebrarum TaxID=2711215 RepID=A0A6G6Y4D8_9SPHN|nr:hypothetical protein [Sphingosinithalassobacter tenebrarum]QIG79436.1 hypothetical protein G5C33_06305 [Sphingosinithalassobacter tenebrarum]